LDERIATIALRDLDPLDEQTGVIKRLQNLGLYHGDDADPDELRDAIVDFQQLYGLMATGELDDAGRAKLREVHRS